MVDETKRISVKYAAAILLLSLVFLFRVTAQFVQAVAPVELLPAFDQWQSGALPYPVLLISQIAILVALGMILIKLFQGRLERRTRRGRIYLILGAVYYLVMVIRLLVGFTIAADHDWFGAYLPAFFHLVLASIMLIMGRYHCAGTR